jgi:hypothetical protein
LRVRLRDWAALALAASLATAARADTISYRTIRRSDFRAKAPPAESRVHADRMGAYTCGHVIPEQPIAIRIEPESRKFVARAPTFRVRGVMDRGCSWWNDALRNAQPAAYILQHEQIHFALIELAARSMQARGRALEKHGATIEAAHAAFQRALEALQRDTAAAVQRRSDELDRDTSGVHRPDVQQRWFDRVTAELARSAQRGGDQRVAGTHVRPRCAKAVATTIRAAGERASGSASSRVTQRSSAD